MGRPVTVTQEKYIHNQARTIAGQIDINLRRDYHCFDPGSPKLGGIIFSLYGRAISSSIGRWSPETLGKVAACGLSSDSEVQFSLDKVRYMGEKIQWALSGYDLLLELATTTIVAAIADNIRADYRKSVLAAKPIAPADAQRDTESILPPRFIRKQIDRETMEVIGGDRLTPPGLDYYDNRRDKGADGFTIPYEGRFGSYKK